MSRILAIPDLHAPFHHPKAVEFLRRLKAEYKPDRVICLGDEIDAAAFSRFPKNPDMDSPGVELAKAIDALRQLYSLFPDVLVCESNHTLRPWLRASEAGLPKRLLRTYREVLRAPNGWNWKPHHRVEGVLFLHGDGFSGKNAALTAAERHRSNVVIGHVHTYAGIQYAQGMFNRIYGVNAGCLIDPKSAAFAYGKHCANKPMLSAAVVIGGVPQLIPLD